MGKAYFERRVSAARGTDSMAADIMRHLHARQHLGKVAVICTQPIVMLSACRKQWLKLARTVQRQRSGTLNADKILKYTHTIARMQKMDFTCRTPLQQPDCDVYCLTPEQAAQLPPQCLSIYLTAPVTDAVAASIAKQISGDSLVVDYVHTTPWETYAMAPKSILEERVATEWQRIKTFFNGRGIDPAKLNNGQVQDVDAMDDALDTLLNSSHQFLEIANSFHHSLELARPLHINKHIRLQYDSLALLAHRVQALSPGAFTQRFLETYNEDDTFFLYDSAKDRLAAVGESLVEAVIRHRQAGRHSLANALILHRSAKQTSGHYLR